MIPAWHEGMLLTFLMNAAWMAAVAAALGWCIERARVHVAARELAWTLGLLVAVAAPLASVLLPQATAASAIEGLRFVATISAPTGTSGFRWTRYVAAAYLLTVGFAGARLLWRWAQLSRLSADTIAVPMTFGILRRRILLPDSFRRVAPPLAVEVALAHERTHLERHDFARNLAMEIATLPVAFHPAVWCMKVRLAQARELVCDDLTARAFGDRHRYAQGLIEAARVIAQSPAAPSRLAMGMLDHTDFEERIMMLNNPAPARFRRGYLLLGAMLTLAPAMTLFGFYFQNDDPVYKIGNGVAAPKLSHKEEPRYSDAAEAEKIQGTVVLGLEISKAGVAEKIVIKRSLHRELDANAVECVKRWRFEPGTKEGSPVRVAATIEVNFKLK
ncbi:MAG: TonB family protein [Burkholderiales bacterium]